MSNNINILISHDSSDEAIASELKNFIETIYLNVQVYVSGRDLIGGQTWIEQIKDRLKSSRVIISLLTTKSLKSNWVYFESGAGFTEDKTIPLLTDNLKPNDLAPPLSLLQVRVLSETGMEMFIKDLSNKLGLREPKTYPSIKDLVTGIENILLSYSAIQLQSIVPQTTMAPKAKKQWIYKKTCLVYDYLIEQEHEISVDIYFYIKKTEIQLFDRSGSIDYIINKMCQADDFLPKPPTQYEMKDHRLVFEKFDRGESIQMVANSLIDLLTRIEKYKRETD